MSLVIEPTLSYSTSQLRTDDSGRWSHLFPLIRPSVTVVNTPDQRHLLLDTAFSESKDVLIAVIGTAGSLSSKILSEACVAAFVLDRFGDSETSAKDIVAVFKNNSFHLDSGVVIVRTALKQDLRVNLQPKLVEISVVGEVKVDHVLSLLASSSVETKSSFDQTKALLEHFVKSAARTKSVFRGEKAGDTISVVHALGVEQFESAKRAVERDLHHLLGSRPPAGDVVYSVHFADINGMSRLENNILAHEISQILETKNLTQCISQSSVIDNQFQGRGWAICLCPVPTQYLAPRSRPLGRIPVSTNNQAQKTVKRSPSVMTFEDSKIRKMIISGCQSVIEAEPTVTEYDTIVGDGDCGYTLRDGAQRVLNFISTADLSDLAAALGDLVEELEVSMGGTSGALYCIFLSSLSQNLRQAQTTQNALQLSLDHLLTFTSARLGDRTCLDCLIPFVERLGITGDARAALEDARKGAEKTKTMEAKLGRSSYLNESSTRGVPDPGAWGLLQLLEGMVSVLPK